MAKVIINNDYSVVTAALVAATMVKVMFKYAWQFQGERSEVYTKRRPLSLFVSLAFTHYIHDWISTEQTTTLII